MFPSSTAECWLRLPIFKRKRGVSWSQWSLQGDLLGPATVRLEILSSRLPGYEFSQMTNIASWWVPLRSMRIIRFLVGFLKWTRVTFAVTKAAMFVPNSRSLVFMSRRGGGCRWKEHVPYPSCSFCLFLKHFSPQPISLHSATRLEKHTWGNEREREVSLILVASWL